LLLAVLRNAKLNGANLGDINFAGADLAGASIDENYRRESDLWNAVGMPEWTPRTPSSSTRGPIPATSRGASVPPNTAPGR
jgi:hypothetical protein